MTNEQKIAYKQEYITSEITLRELATKYAVPQATLFRIASREHWTDKRKDYLNKAEAKADQLSLKELERSRVQEVAHLNKAIIYLFDYVKGIMGKSPKSHSEASKSLSDLIRVRELLLGNATDIIVNEVRDRKLLEIVHKLKGLPKPIQDNEIVSITPIRTPDNLNKLGSIKLDEQDTTDKGEGQSGVGASPPKP